MLRAYFRNFSGGKAVDFVETEKSQIVLHELEKDWWILAVSIHFTPRKHYLNGH